MVIGFELYEDPARRFAGVLTAFKRDKFAKNKKTTSKERLSLLPRFKV